MRLLRIVVIVVLLGILAAGLFLWFNVPGKVDLAEYAPADSLIYVEFNNLADVARAIQNTDVWKAAAPITHSRPANENRLFTAAARAGLGPIESVLFARTQVALVVVGLNTTEQNDTLKVRPEIALIAETHTAAWRTRPVMVDVVKRLANFAYGASSCSGPDNNDRFECSIPGSDRKLLGVVFGSEVILANSDDALKSCLDVRAGTRANIRTDREFVKARSSVLTQQSLGFGYISAANSARLFSWAAPLLMGAAPGDQQLQQLLAVSASKILRGIAWTALPSRGGIEDRFLFSLEPDVVSRLQPAFQIQDKGHDDYFWKLVPGDFQSLTIYRSGNLLAAWNSLNSAVAFKLDAVPAVLFGSLLKSSLAVYGLEDPKEAFYAIDSPLLTMKVPAAEGSVLIAYMGEEAQWVKSIQRDLLKSNKVQVVYGQADPDLRKEFMAVFAGDHMMIGKTENVRACLLAMRNSEAAATEEKKKMQDAARASTAAIVTYANDEARLTNFISTLLVLQGRRLSGDELAGLQEQLRRSSFAATETRLGSDGIERKTQSAFGQFSTFISLLEPSNPAAASR